MVCQPMCAGQVVINGPFLFDRPVRFNMFLMYQIKMDRTSYFTIPISYLMNKTFPILSFKDSPFKLK